jgi:probable rRNA maturation factor
MRELARRVLARMGVHEGEIGVLVCDDATIRSLNRHFRAKDAATDVLSFPAGYPQPDGPVYLGDVAISLDTSRRQAEAAGVAVLTELKTLLIHALLHLHGYDHEVDDGAMEALEEELRRELLP